MAYTISARLSGDSAILKPKSFLGSQQFQAYRAATEGAKYDPVGRCQIATLARAGAILTALHARGFALDVDPALSAEVKRVEEARTLRAAESTAVADRVDAELQAQGKGLYPFQRAGVRFLAERHAVLLADEMGLGKTIQTLVSLPKGAPVLVICPAPAKGVWRREAGKWRPEFRVTILSGKGSFRWPEPGEIVVVNYDVLPDPPAEESPKNRGPVVPNYVIPEKGATESLPGVVRLTPPQGTVLVGDEIHMTKNAKTKRTVAFRAISDAVQKSAGRIVALTGTPLLNRPPELWTLLQGIGLAREAFGSWDRFAEMMGGKKECVAKGKWVYTWRGAVSSDVGPRLARVMLRRLRSEVLPELPAKTYRTVDAELDAKNRKVCDEELAALDKIRRFEGMIEENGKTPFEELSTARAALAMAKIPAMLAIIENFEEQDEPLVVFSAHRAPIDKLAGRDGWRTITGDTDSEDRSAIEEAFQRGELKGVACTIQAGGVAITLTRAAHALFVDRHWTPALNLQAEDRICRIGQSRGCIITSLEADHPLDKRVAELIEKKQTLIESSVEQARRLEGASQEVDFEALLREMGAELHNVDPSDNEVAFHKMGRCFEGCRVCKPKIVRRQAESDTERKAGFAIQWLNAHNEDGASIENGVGFSKIDTGIGESLAEALHKGNGLTPKQWAVVVKLAHKYRGQIS